MDFTPLPGGMPSLLHLGKTADSLQPPETNWNYSLHIPQQRQQWRRWSKAKNENRIERNQPGTGDPTSHWEPRICFLLAGGGLRHFWPWPNTLDSISSISHGGVPCYSPGVSGSRETLSEVARAWLLFSTVKTLALLSWSVKWAETAGPCAKGWKSPRRGRNMGRYK